MPARTASGRPRARHILQHSTVELERMGWRGETYSSRSQGGRPAPYIDGMDSDSDCSYDDLANVPEHMLAASWQQDCSTPPARESDRLEHLRAGGVCASARRAQTEGRQDTGGGVPSSWALTVTVTADPLFQHLCQHELLPLDCLARCCAVCVQWRGALRRNLPLLTRLDFCATPERCKDRVTLITVSCCVARAGPRLRVVDLRDCPEITDGCMGALTSAITACCPSVTEVRHGGQFVNFAVISAQPPFGTMVQFKVRRRTQLKSMFQTFASNRAGLTYAALKEKYRAYLRGDLHFYFRERGSRICGTDTANSLELQDEDFKDVEPFSGVCVIDAVMDHDLCIKIKLAGSPPNIQYFEDGFGGVLESDGVPFKVKWLAPLKGVMEAFAVRQGRTRDELRFSFEGRKVREKLTPSVCKMKDGDVIHATLKDIGGWVEDEKEESEGERKAEESSEEEEGGVWGVGGGGEGDDMEGASGSGIDQDEEEESDDHDGGWFDYDSYSSTEDIWSDEDVMPSFGTVHTIH